MNSVIKDVVFRTNGELYIGVVGSVRSGKSTFIRKFINLTKQKSHKKKT